MGKSMNTASKVSMQRSSSWGSKNENGNCQKRSQLGIKIDGLKKTCEKSNKRRLTGRTYKNILKSWVKASQKPAGLPQTGGGAGRDTKSNGSIGAEEVAVERSLTPLRERRVECEPKKELSKDSSDTCTKLISNSQTKDAKDLDVCCKLEWVEVEKTSNDKESIHHQLDAELDKDHTTCSICALEGELLYCGGKGCNRRFHLSCVDPPFSFVPPGAWHCAWCAQKKIEFGVYSVSNGISSIWGVRKVELENEGEQKQYMVKYKTLAHVHNCWIPEKELKERAPVLLAQYKNNIYRTEWKAEWAMPHRLLQKRQLRLPKQSYSAADDYKSKDFDCQNEWLVKWESLGYDRVTWELETASFLKSPEAAELMKDFELRHSKRVTRISAEDEEKKEPSIGKLDSPYQGLTGICSEHEKYIDKLRKCWSKKQNSVLFDNEERFAKVVLFIISLKDYNLPFLLVTTSGSLPDWEAEFSRHKSSNTVVYNGNNDVRASIRSLDFSNEYGCIMFQVLLTTSVVVIEDLNILKGIKWGGVFVDDCQQPVIHNHLHQIKALPTDIRLLIASDHISEKRYVYNRLLSFISSEIDGEKEKASDLDDNIPILKEKLASFIAYESKHQDQASRFAEHWVPVRLSNVQLEQYSAALLSKSKLLCSSPRNGLSNSLHELLVLERECCGHPYVVDLDNSLRRSLTNDLPTSERLNAEIEMSGKLQLLDKCLSHIKKQGLRVLIVFQPSVGPGKISAGDVLDDFVLQRFGEDSYVRIGDRDVTRSKKRAALKLFNQRESKQFVFLLEQRACAPSIRLSSVDTVILFDSDWDPLNDLKALQRVSLRSQSQELKVFRLYSIHTIEEKVLILAKQALAPDNLKDMGRRTCHSLLTWGAFHIFDKLDQFHAHSDSDQSPHLANESCFLNDVASEFLALLLNNNENAGLKSLIILKVQQSNGTYINNTSLYGETEAGSTESISLIEKMMQNESTVVFWKNLIEGRRPKWKFLANSSHMNQTKQPEKCPEETQSIEKAAKRTWWIENGASIQLKPVLKRKRSCIGARKGKTSSGMPALACKKSKLKEINDKNTASNGKIGRPSKTNADYISKRKKCQSLLDRHDQQTASDGNKGNFYVDRKGSSSTALGFIDSKETDMQERNEKKTASSRKRASPSKTLAEYILERKKCKSLLDRDGREMALNGKRESPLETVKPNCIPKRVEENGSSFGKQCQTDIAEGQLKNVQICPAQSSKGEQEQIRTDHSLEDSTALEDFDYTSTLSLSASVEKQTTVACNSQIPQAASIPHEDHHSTLSGQEERDLETIMQKVVEQALKIKQDKKLQLQAEFEKEINQVTEKYVKKIEDVEDQLSEKMKEFETYYRKANERKSLVRSVSANSGTAQGVKLSEIQQGAKTRASRCRKASEVSNSTATTTRAKASFASSPTICPSPSSCLSKMPTNFVAHPDRCHYSPPLSNQILPANKPKTVHLGNLVPAIGVRTMAPHLRSTCCPAEVSPICYPQTQIGLPTPILLYPAVPSSHPLGPTYQPVFGIQAPVPNHIRSPLPKVSPPCFSQPQNGKDISHLTASSKSASEITLEKPLQDSENTTDVSTLSTSELLSQFFTQMTKK